MAGTRMEAERVSARGGCRRRTGGGRGGRMTNRGFPRKSAERRSKRRSGARIGSSKRCAARRGLLSDRPQDRVPVAARADHSRGQRAQASPSIRGPRGSRGRSRSGSAVWAGPRSGSTTRRRQRPRTWRPWRWPRFQQYANPDLSSARGADSLDGSDAARGWVESGLRKSLHEACRRHVEAVLPPPTSSRFHPHQGRRPPPRRPTHCCTTFP